MPAIEVVYYRDINDEVPFLTWLAELRSRKAVAKCVMLVRLLRQRGSDLRRPQADILRDEIHELRGRFGKVQVRLLYFFSGKRAVISHGFIKSSSRVPDKEIDDAVTRKLAFRENPDKHSFEERES